MDMTSIQLRLANRQDVQLLRHWDNQPHVIAATDDDWEWETALAKRPPWREQLIAELMGRPLGFIQIIDPALEETHYWGDVPKNLRAIDIWIGEADDLGKGYGTIMMELAIRRCFDEPNVKAILIDPLATNTRAHKFYKKVGFTFVEKKIFDGDECFVFRLDREHWTRH